MWKRSRIYLVYIVAGVVLAILDSFLLSPAWIALGWRKPVADWLASVGLGSLAGYWSIVWLNAVGIALLTIAGALVAIFARRRWLLKTALLSVTCVTGPYLWSVANGFNPLAYGFRVVCLEAAFYIAVITAGLLAALVARPIRNKLCTPSSPGFPVAGYS